MSSTEEMRKEIQKLILEEMTLFAQEHREEIVRRAMAKWKIRQQEGQQSEQAELSELD